MKKTMKHVHNQSGVTLIELLAVIVILGILAAVAVPAVMGQFDNAKTNADKTNLTIINDAIERYAVENGGSYPDLDDAEASVSGELNKLLDVLDEHIKDFPATKSDGKTTWTLDRDATDTSVIIRVR